MCDAICEIQLIIVRIVTTLLKTFAGSIICVTLQFAAAAAGAAAAACLRALCCSSCDFLQPLPPNKSLFPSVADNKLNLQQFVRTGACRQAKFHGSDWLQVTFGHVTHSHISPLAIKFGSNKTRRWQLHYCRRST